MGWNGHLVIDMDAHIRERADRFYKDYIDPEYRGAYQQLCEAVAKQEAKGDRYSLFGSRNSVIEQIETGRPLGVRDTYGLSRRSEMEHGRIAFPPGRKDPLPPIRQEVNRDVKARLEDMDTRPRSTLTSCSRPMYQATAPCAISASRTPFTSLSPPGRRFLAGAADDPMKER